MDIESVRTETKIIAIIYSITTFERRKLAWWRRRTGKYGRMVRQNVIDMYEQNKQELKFMIELLNCTAATSAQCFESISKKMFADKRCNWGRVLTAYALALTLAMWLEEHGVKEFNEFGGLLGDVITENIASFVPEQNAWADL